MIDKITVEEAIRRIKAQKRGYTPHTEEDIIRILEQIEATSEAERRGFEEAVSKLELVFEKWESLNHYLAERTPYESEKMHEADRIIWNCIEVRKTCIREAREAMYDETEKEDL